MTVRFTKTARQELAAQLAYLAAVNHTAALRLSAEVREALALVDAGVAQGVEMELRSGRRARRWLVPPLVLFYTQRGQTVVVLRVRHGAQRQLTR